MRFLAGLIFCALATASSPVYSADPSQVFSTILGEIGRQIERDRHKKQLKRLRPFWDACAKGDVAACDRAARFPFLTDQVRADIARMRHAAEIRPAYERNFHACQKMDPAACQAALAYPYLSDTDRRNLLNWKQGADQRYQALAAFRQNQQNCYVGSIVACDAALGDRHLDESAIPGLERQRAKLQLAEQERQAREQKRQAALSAFQRNRRSCYAGSITACNAAINDRHLDESAIPDLERQRARLQLADRQRRAREKQRQAAIREFDQLRTRCAEGDRGACRLAVAHTQVHSSDIVFLEKRHRELAPIHERVANFFAQAKLANINDAGFNTSLAFALLGVIALSGVGAGTFFVLRNRGAAVPALPEQPGLKPITPNEPAEHETAQTFTLTGHMPTDVRRAIRQANP